MKYRDLIANELRSLKQKCRLNVHFCDYLLELNDEVEKNKRKSNVKFGFYFLNRFGRVKNN